MPFSASRSGLSPAVTSSAAAVCVPTPVLATSLANQLIEAMSKAAEAEPDEEKRSRLRQAASFLVTTGRDVLGHVAGAAISKSAGF